MKIVLKRLRPSEFEDILAVNALYRPGPMDFIPIYIKRKHNEQDVLYPHPDLKHILEETYGVLIYQEQIMRIAHDIAGYSLGEYPAISRSEEHTSELQSRGHLVCRLLLEKKKKRLLLNIVKFT